MLVVQPRAGHCADKELGAVGGRSGIGHAQKAGGVVAQLEVLVLEGGAVDALASRSIPCSEVSALCSMALSGHISLVTHDVDTS